MSVGRILAFFIDLLRRLYNTLALPWSVWYTWNLTVENIGLCGSGKGISSAQNVNENIMIGNIRRRCSRLL